MFGRKKKTVNELFLKFIEDCKKTDEYKEAVKDYEEMCKGYQDEINKGTLQTFHYPVVGIEVRPYTEDKKAWIYSGCCADSSVWNYMSKRYPKEGLPTKGTYYTPEELKPFATN